jgi:hypothetical protein
MDDEMMDEPRLLFFLTVEREDREYYRPTGDPLGHTYEKRTPRFYGVRCGDESELPDGMVGDQGVSDIDYLDYMRFANPEVIRLISGHVCSVLSLVTGTLFVFCSSAICC